MYKLKWIYLWVEVHQAGSKPTGTHPGHIWTETENQIKKCSDFFSISCLHWKHKCRVFFFADNNNFYSHKKAATTWSCSGLFSLTAQLWQERPEACIMLSYQQVPLNPSHWDLEREILLFCINISFIFSQFSRQIFPGLFRVLKTK